jgi:hypothetical protein
MSVKLSIVGAIFLAGLLGDGALARLPERLPSSLECVLADKQCNGQCSAVERCLRRTVSKEDERIQHRMNRPLGFLLDAGGYRDARRWLKIDNFPL